MEEPSSARSLYVSLAALGAPGERAAEWFAAAFEQAHGTSPRVGNIVAYCGREALMALLDLGGSRSRDFTDAADAVVQAAVAVRREEVDPGTLLEAVDHLEATIAGPGPHVRRLVTVIADQSHRTPARTEADLFHAYVQVLGSLNRLTHAPESADLDRARELLDEAFTTVQRLFAPISERLDAIDALVAVSDPVDHDVAALLAWHGDPRILNYFFGRVHGLSWFRALAEHPLLQPPDAPFWPAFPYLATLAETDPVDVRTWLENRAPGRDLSDQQAYSLIQIAQRLHGSSGEAVLHIADGHFDNRNILELVTRYLMDAPASEHAASASREMLKRALQALSADADSPGSAYTATGLLHVAISGASQDQPERWLQMLCAKAKDMLDRDEPLRAWAIQRIQAVASLALDGTSPLLDQFVAAIRDVTEIAGKAGVPASVRFDALRRLPPPLAGRLIATDLLGSKELDVGSAVSLLESEVADSRPMPETLSLLRHLRERKALGLIEALARALGPPPAPAVTEAFEDSDEFPDEWTRAFGWSDALPIELQQQWADAVARVAVHWGAPSPDGAVFPPPIATFLPARSPFSTDELAELTPLSAAATVASWRPDPTDYHGPSTYGLATVVKDLIAANPDGWMGEDASEIVHTLREPTYVAAYFEAVAASPEAELPLAVLGAIEQLVEPGGVTQQLTGGPDITWPLDLALRLIPRLDIAQPDTQRRVWALLHGAAHVNDAQNPLSAPEAPETPRDAQPPAYGTHTRVLGAAFGVADKVMLADDAPPPELVSLLDEAVALASPRGVHARTALGSNLPWLMHHASAWTESRWNVLVGQDAPHGLGAYTFQSYLQHGRPYQPLLAGHRDLYRAALESVPDAARIHILHGMLWGIDGYEPPTVVDQLLATGGAAVSEAANWLALGASRSPEMDLAPVIAFWTAAIEHKLEPAQYEGFGAFAIVDHLPDATWLDLTLQTAKLCAGRLTFPDRIGARAAAVTDDARAMWLVAALLSSNLDLWHIYDIGRSGLEILSGAHAHDPAAEDELRERLLEREFYDARPGPP